MLRKARFGDEMLRSGPLQFIFGFIHIFAEHDVTCSGR